MMMMIKSDHDSSLSLSVFDDHHFKRLIVLPTQSTRASSGSSPAPHFMEAAQLNDA